MLIKFHAPIQVELVINWDKLRYKESLHHIGLNPLWTLFLDSFTWCLWNWKCVHFYISWCTIQCMLLSEIITRLHLMGNGNIENSANTTWTYLTLFRPGGSLGTPPPQRFLSITLRAFEIILWNFVTFPKIYWEIRWNLKFFKIRSRDQPWSAVSFWFSDSISIKNYIFGKLSSFPLEWCIICLVSRRSGFGHCF